MTPPTLARVLHWSRHHKVRVGVYTSGVLLVFLTALGVIAERTADQDDPNDRRSASEVPVSKRPTPTPTPTSSATKPSPRPTAKRPVSLGRIDVDPAYEQRRYGDAAAPYPTKLPSSPSIDSGAATFRVKGKWAGKVTIPASRSAEHVRCSRWTDGDDTHQIYDVTTSSGNDAYEPLYIKDGEAILRIHRIFDAGEGPNGSESTYISLTTSTDGVDYSGEGSDQPEPDETPATKIRYAYSPDARSVRFDVNTTLFDSGFTFDEGLGAVAVRGTVTCETLSPEPVDYY